MEILQKKCVNCEKIIFKPINESLKNWINRHKFCSKNCFNLSKVGKIPPTGYSFEKGHVSCWKGTKGLLKPNSGSFKKGNKLSKETRQKMLGRVPWNKNKPFLQIRGVNNSNWKGGITPLIRSIRNLPEMKDWSIDCMKRDNFTCQECGRKRCVGDRVVLDVHHNLVSFKDIIKNNNIKTLDDARNCKELWDRLNGKTLCQQCHNKTKGSNQYKIR